MSNKQITTEEILEIMEFFESQDNIDHDTNAASDVDYYTDYFHFGKAKGEYTLSNRSD